MCWLSEISVTFCNELQVYRTLKKRVWLRRRHTISFLKVLGGLFPSQQIYSYGDAQKLVSCS